MPLPAPPQDVLARELLAARSLLLEAAAALDRIDEAGQLSDSEDGRKLLGAAAILAAPGAPDRAQRLQLLFSRPYRANWESEFAIARSTQRDPKANH